MSAFTLRVSDGVRSISLTSGDGDPSADYVPYPGDGGIEPLVEPCRVVIEGEGYARTLGRDLKRLFVSARRYADKLTGKPVFVYWQGEGDAYERRSLLYGGDVTWGPDTLDTMWAGGLFEVAIEWLRAPWLERGDAEQAITVTNNNGSSATGLQIYNHDDFTGGSVEEGAWLGPLGLTASEEDIEDTDGHDNWVQMSVDAIEGDLPAPARIEIDNSYSAGEMETVYIGHFVDGSGETWVLEGENAISAGAVLPVTPDPLLYSNGQYKTGTINNDDVAATRMTWFLPSDLLTDAQGRSFRVMLRLADFFDGNARLWWRLELNSSSILWQSDKVKIDNSYLLYDLGVMTLPPLRHSENPAAIASLDFSIWGQSIGLDGGSLKVDFVYLLPVDSFRKLEPITLGTDDDEVLVDDGPRNAVYLINNSGQEVGSYTAEGDPIMLMPGVTQKLYFLMTDLAGGADVLRTANITVKYRARWSSI